MHYSVRASSSIPVQRKFPMTTSSTTNKKTIPNNNRKKLHSNAVDHQLKITLFPSALPLPNATNPNNANANQDYQRQAGANLLPTPKASETETDLRTDQALAPDAVPTSSTAPKQTAALPAARSRHYGNCNTFANLQSRSRTLRKTFTNFRKTSANLRETSANLRKPPQSPYGNLVIAPDVSSAPSDHACALHNSRTSTSHLCSLRTDLPLSTMPNDPLRILQWNSN